MASFLKLRIKRIRIKRMRMELLFKVSNGTNTANELPPHDAFPLQCHTTDAFIVENISNI